MRIYVKAPTALAHRVNITYDITFSGADYICGFSEGKQNRAKIVGGGGVPS